MSCCKKPDLACFTCAKVVEDTAGAVIQARDEAERKALDGLSRYKFDRFGYWAARWVAFNQVLPKRDQAANPFKDLVQAARARGFGPPGTTNRIPGGAV